MERPPTNTCADIEIVAGKDGPPQTAPTPLPPADVEAVKSSLQRLELENLLVLFPDHTESAETPPNQHEELLIQSIHHFLQVERIRRANDQVAIKRPLRSVLLLSTTKKNALRFHHLFSSHAQLRTAAQGTQQISSEHPLNFLLADHDVVLTKPEYALRHAHRHTLNLRRTSLLVIDQAEDAGMRSHPASQFIRDFYRALPRSRRPRILALSRVRLTRLMLYPVEYNLMSRSCLGRSHDVLWSSCYGTSARDVQGGLIDVETITYNGHYEDSNDIHHHDRQTNLPTKKPANPENDDFSLLERETGNLGVALFLKGSQRRKIRGRNSRLRTLSIRNASRASLRGDDFVGMSEKVFYLVRELQFVYACSTKSHQLSVAIHAGHPTVACALCELLHSLPMFRALNTRVVLGQIKPELHQISSLPSTLAGQWQGEETDDEEVSGLAAGTVHILIVANTYFVQGSVQRPLPPTPLVIRFDGSVPDPSMDGGGGRCRVIVFKQRRYYNADLNGGYARGLTQNGAHLGRAKASRNDKSGNVIDLTDDDHENDQPTRRNQRPIEDSRLPLRNRAAKSLSRKRKIPGSQMPVINGDSQTVVDHRRTEDMVRSTQVAEEERRAFHCKLPAPLMGPDSESNPISYQYSVVLCDHIPSNASASLPGSLRRCGIEDIVFLFSQKLSNDDLLISLEDSFLGTGSSLSVSGYARLLYHGSITLSPEQLRQAREYSAVVFPFLINGVYSSHFVWEEEMSFEHPMESGTGRNYCRMYLILPARDKSARQPKTATLVHEATGHESSNCVTGKAEYDADKVYKEIMQKYFDVHEPNRAELDFRYSREIDWSIVQTVITLQDKEVRAEECRKVESLSPEHYKQLEATLLYSSNASDFCLLSGTLQENLCPLSHIHRSRRFPLHEDGTVALHDDLIHLINVHMDEETMTKQAEVAKGITKETTSVELIDLTKKASGDGNAIPPSEKGQPNEDEIAPKDEALASIQAPSPVKWCKKRNHFVHDKMVGPTKRRRTTGQFSTMKRFDARRNVMKKRKFWVGDVHYSIETYFKKYYPQELKNLIQPLLTAVQPKVMGFVELCDLLQGMSLRQVCERHVSRTSDVRLLIPELCRRHPMSFGMLFLPPVAVLIEHHLSVCDFKEFLFRRTGIKCEHSLLMRSVTSKAVSSIANYERLEFLGDALLKLSTTIRLFTRYPHTSEGGMHFRRKDIVCNARLCQIGEKIGLFNYCKFRREPSGEWKPPGTDVAGRIQMITEKGLADVVEAVCGAYFLHGASSANSDALASETVTLDGNGTSENWVIDLCDSSDEDEEPNDKRPRQDRETTNDAKEEPVLIDPCSDERRQEPNSNHPFSAISVEQGYICGYKLLESLSVFEDKEPTHSEMLLSAAHAMHVQGTPAPTEISPAAFPYDERLVNPIKPWEDHFGIIEKNIGYVFKRRPLLVCALTHSSYNSHKSKAHADLETFQRLEFLGDAIADFFVVRYLYEMYPELDPGKLTDLKSNVVSNEAFARTSVTLGLHNFLYINNEKLAQDVQRFAGSVGQDLTQEDELGGHSTYKRNLGELAAPKILGDVFESILGAVYVDSGLRHAWRVCMNLLRDSLRINADPGRDDMHPVHELSEMVLKVWKLARGPLYDPIRTVRFGNLKVVAVYILGEKIAIGKGSKWKRARLQAAVKALERLRSAEDDPKGDGAKLKALLQERSIQLLLREKRGRELQRTTNGR
ncbi:Endoribonuclease Dicer-like [Gracilariopsis chorda]|uniref:Endoribonuclease Dicer-like n=1 Tax=Gracilariopsis chorda TaxID=448386 RepID=A0A2V3IFX9_9FLOR|nr:Endoribonuclease Dicer-like [Gracilariopsis chorda]|eukprot:PXF40961.1 Endoribonuclease Dicer-like [Gracilariopsis chorda]